MSHQTIAIPSPQPAKAPRWKKWLSLENRYIPPIFITLILLAGQLSFGILESYEKTLLAIGTAIVTELILGRIFLGKVPASRQRVYHRHQRRHFTALSRLLALRALRRYRHYVQICFAAQGKAPLESIQFRHLRHALSSGYQRRGHAQHSVGKQPVVADRDLGFRLAHHLAAASLSYQRHLCRLFHCPGLSARVDHP